MVAESGSTVAFGGVVVVRSIGSATDFASTLFVGVFPEDFTAALAPLPPPKKLMIERCGTAAAFAFAFGGMLIFPTLDKMTFFAPTISKQTAKRRPNIV